MGGACGAQDLLGGGAGNGRVRNEGHLVGGKAGRGLVWVVPRWAQPYTGRDLREEAGYGRGRSRLGMSMSELSLVVAPRSALGIFLFTYFIHMYMCVPTGVYMHRVCVYKHVKHSY
jgi:hypothetical protein